MTPTPEMIEAAAREMCRQKGEFQDRIVHYFVAQDGTKILSHIDVGPCEPYWKWRYSDKAERILAAALAVAPSTRMIEAVARALCKLNGTCIDHRDGRDLCPDLTDCIDSKSYMSDAKVVLAAALAAVPAPTVPRREAIERELVERGLTIVQILPTSGRTIAVHARIEEVLDAVADAMDKPECPECARLRATIGGPVACEEHTT